MVVLRDGSLKCGLAILLAYLACVPTITYCLNPSLEDEHQSITVNNDSNLFQNSGPATSVDSRVLTGSAQNNYGSVSAESLVRSTATGDTTFNFTVPIDSSQVSGIEATYNPQASEDPDPTDPAVLACDATTGNERKSCLSSRYHM